MNVQVDDTALMTVHQAEKRTTVSWATYFFFVQQACLVA
jgi:hypothetical protein